MENKNIKIIARQIAPEYQESPLEYGEEELCHAVIRGNDDLKEICGEGSETFKRVLQILEQGELEEVLREVADGDHYYFASAEEAINNYLPPEREKGYKYSDAEIEELKNLLPRYGDYYGRDDEEIALAVLKIVSGEEWDVTEIHGSVQREWNYMYYEKSAWDKKSIEWAEAAYFNTGDEWEVRYADQEDDYEYSQYTTAWDDEGIKKEIADSAGVLPDEVQLEKFSGWARSATYEIA